MVETDETKETREKKVDLKEIYVEIFGDWTGPRVKRDIRYGDKKTKFMVQLPIPTTDETSEELYNVKLSTILAKGVKQHSYDNDSNLGVILEGKAKAGIAASELAVIVAETLEASLFVTEEEKATKVSEVKKIKAAKAELGMSLDEMIALARKVKAGEAI
jgi:hypothetical protein